MGEKTKIFDITKVLVNPEKGIPTKTEHFDKRLEKINKDKLKKEKENELKHKSNKDTKDN